MFWKNETQFSRFTIDAIVASVHMHSISDLNWIRIRSPHFIDISMNANERVYNFRPSIALGNSNCSMMKINFRSLHNSRRFNDFMTITFRSVRSVGFLWVVLFASLQLDRVIYDLIGCTKEQSNSQKQIEMAEWAFLLCWLLVGATMILIWQSLYQQYLSPFKIKATTGWNGWNILALRFASIPTQFNWIWTSIKCRWRWWFPNDVEIELNIYSTRGVIRYIHI